MRHGPVLAVACLLVGTGLTPAQELVPPPRPDASSTAAPALPPGGSSAPPSMPGQLPSFAAPPAGTSFAQPGPYPQPGPYGPPPPPGSYAPPPPTNPVPPVFGSDPASNPRLWIGADLLLWWTKGQPLSVPLVTTGPSSQGANAGNIGAPGTTSLDSSLHYGVQGGFQFYAGGWFDTDRTIGMDGSLFILGQASSGYDVIDRSGVGNLILNEPVSGAPFTTLVSAPGLETGAVSVANTSRFGGGDINILYNLFRANGWTLNLLGGYRLLVLDESLTINANSTLYTTTTYTDYVGNILATAPPGSSVTITDGFKTRNQFNGGQIGFNGQYLWGRWSIDGAAKVAFGSTHETVTVDGNTYVYPINASPVVLSGGNYATLQVGHYTANRFAVAPQGQINLGYQFTPCLRGLVGYSFLYLSSVARPGNQIDNTYDGINHPLVPLYQSSFWAQGLNLGLQLRF